MGIPESTERTNNRIMEEIHIPHTCTPPPPVGEEKIQIRELDNIAQLAFKGTMRSCDCHCCHDDEICMLMRCRRKKEASKVKQTTRQSNTTHPCMSCDCHMTCKFSSHVLSLSSGMKSLNRIQSIVFDTAYFTSENLLISAPTGAGKTNIAMLTVLREIKNNIEAGVIRRDQFKVQH